MSLERERVCVPVEIDPPSHSGAQKSHAKMLSPKFRPGQSAPSPESKSVADKKLTMANKNRSKSSGLHEIEEDLHCPFLDTLNECDWKFHWARTVHLDPEAAVVDNPTLNLNVQMAATLVEQAILGRFMPLEVIYHRNHEQAKEAYVLYYRLRPARVVSFFVLVMLPVFEVPFWCKGEMPQPCGDPELYTLSGIPYIKTWHSLLIQALCLAFLVFSTILQWYFLHKSFWTRPLSFCKVGLLAIMMVLVMIPAAGMYGPEATLLSMYIRFIIPIVFTRPLRMCSRMIARIMPTCVNIAVLLVIFLLLSAYVGMLLFGKKTSEFKDYPTSLLNLMVLLTTANNPNVWAPAYTTNRWAFVFFFIFLVVGLFFLCNLAFMVIYSNYKVEIANEVAKRTSLQYTTLDAAFTLLDRLQQNSINGSSLIALLHAMNYRDIPDFQLHERNIFFALGKNEHSMIHRAEFEAVYSLIALEMEQQVQSLPQPAGPFRKMISKFWWLQFSDHPPYTHFIWAATSVSLVLAILERRAEEDDALKRNLILAEFSMGWLFILDTLIKIVLQSWSVYWRRNLNRFDFVFALLLFLIFAPSSVFGIEPHWVSFLFIAKAFRVLSLVTLISHWGLMARTLINLLPATAPILILQFLICSSFSLLGVHLFGGKVYIGHPLLENTEYANGRLFAFNYNDYASALVTSFNLCVVNNWYVIMDAYAFVTETPWSRSFFIVFWAVAVAFSLPIVVAFFVEAFVKQMEKGVLLQVPQGDSVFPSKSTYTRKLSYHDLYKDIVKNPAGPMSTMSI